MANPKAVINYNGIGRETVTLKIDDSTIKYSATAADGSVSVGLAVTLSADGTVALCADADRVLGKLLEVTHDGFCTVQVGGFVTLPGGASATLTRGLAIVGALGASSAKGYIRVVATGTAAELGKCHGYIVESGTSTAVVVKL